MKLHLLLNSPLKIFCLCFSFALVSTVLNGGWMHLYGLRRDRTELQSQISMLKNDVSTLGDQLKRAKDPTFIQHQAMDQLDMASDNDLVFVFSE